MKISKYVGSACAAILVGFALNVSAEDTNVNYEHTDSKGTRVKIEGSTESKVDSKGNVEAKTDYTRETDPKGLLNKQKETSTVKEERDVDGEADVSKKSVDAAGTLRKEDTTVDVDKHSDGSETVTTEKKVVVDPKGLMNKETSKTTDTVKKNADGTVANVEVDKH